MSEARGFIANRYVVAASLLEAERRAVDMTLRCWTVGRTSAQTPRVWATDCVQVGLWAFLSGRRQNKAHVFYEEE